MAYICSIKCDSGFEMDLYNTPRIPKKGYSSHYITMKGLQEVEIWMAEQGYKDKIKDQKDIDFFITQGWIRAYEN